MSLEKIVRPFQTRTVTPPQQVASASPPVVANVVLQVGKNGAGKTFNGSASSSLTAYMDKKPKETALA